MIYSAAFWSLLDWGSRMSWIRNMSILVAKIKYWLWTNTQQFSSNLVGVRMLVLVVDHLWVCKALAQNLDYTCSVCFLCYAHWSQCVKLNRSSICEEWLLVLCLLCCHLLLNPRHCPEGHPSCSHVSGMLVLTSMPSAYMEQSATHKMQPRVSTY